MLMHPPEPSTAEAQAFFDTHFLSYELDAFARTPDVNGATRVAAALLAMGQGSRALDALQSFAQTRDYWIQHYRSVALLQLSRLEEAEAVLREYLLLSPDDYRAEADLGRILLAAGRKEAAQVAFTSACTKADADALTLNDGGVATFLLDDPKAALRYFRRALREDDRCVPAINNAGVCYQLRAQHDLAVRFFNRALSLDPACKIAVYNLAEAHIGGEEYDAAIRLLEFHRNGMPGDLAMLERLAWSYGCYGNNAKVVEVLEHAVEISSEQDACMLNNLGVARVACGKDEAAERAYRRAIQVDPESVTLRINFGQLLASRGRWREVLGALPERNDSPLNADAAALRCQALMNLTEHQDAAVLLTKAHRQFPDDRRFIAWLGFLLVSRLNEIDSAIELLQPAVARYPDDLLMANNLSYALVKVGRLAEARALLAVHEGAMKNPTTAAALLMVATNGLMQIREGAFDAGIKAYEFVRQRVKGALAQRVDQKILVERGRRWLEVGRKSEARDALVKASQGVDEEFAAEARNLLALVGTPGSLLN
jgi:tetratricopeptide (TPR) repeat protein